MGVGDRRLGAALGVAEGAGVGARGLRADLERALGGDPGDGAAARPDGDDVDHRDLARVGTDGALGRQGRLTREDDGHVGRRAAAVAREDLVEAGAAGDETGTERPGGRTREDRRDRLVHDLVGREHAAVGLHDVEGQLLGAADELVEPVVDVRDVAGHVGLDRGVDEGRHRPLVLAVLAQHLRADRDDGVRVLATEHLTHRELVAVVGVGVQEAHADRRDAAVLEPAGDRDGTFLVEGADLVALEVEPAPDRLDVVGRHDAGGLDPEVGVAVAVGDGLAGDLEDELVALRRDEAERLDLALEELVRRDGRAVRDGADVVTARVHEVEDLADAGEEAVGGVARCRGRLRRDELARVLVERDDVGERATGVDADADPAACGGACCHGEDSTGGTPPGRWHMLPTPDRFRANPRQNRRGGRVDVEGEASAPSPG